MTVYIEYVLINNFVIDYFLLSATHIITGKKDKAIKRVIAALCGALIALIYPLISDLGAITALIKIAAGLIIIFAAAGYTSVKDYYVNAAVFFFITAFTGGAVIGVFSVSGLGYGEFSVALCTVPVYLLVKAVKSAAKYFYTRAGEENNSYDCEITFNGKTVRLKGFMDTGNSLYDGDSPVVVCNKKTALKIISGGSLKVKYIPVNTATGKSKVLSFKVDEFKIYISGRTNIFSNITVAAVKNAGVGYDLILHPALKEKVNERFFAS